MDAEALFLDEGVVADRVDLQAGGKRDRPQRAVRRKRDVVGLGHRAEPDRLGDAADVRGVRD